jgi:hypothetical protein
MRRSLALALLLLVLVLCIPAPATAQGRILVDTLRSKAIAGNAIGDTPNREVFVYTPPSYDRTPNRRSRASGSTARIRDSICSRRWTVSGAWMPASSWW